MTVPTRRIVDAEIAALIEAYEAYAIVPCGAATKPHIPLVLSGHHHRILADAGYVFRCTNCGQPFEPYVIS